jgi:hypothetical protein
LTTTTTTIIIIIIIIIITGNYGRFWIILRVALDNKHACIKTPDCMVPYGHLLRNTSLKSLMTPSLLANDIPITFA